jgi:ribosomal protein L7Ae-like RNA K-turn-binding protein
LTKDLSLIGLARKAGRLAVGSDAALEAVRSGRAKLIILASDAAENTVSRIFNRHDDVPIHRLRVPKEELGGAVGLAACSAVALCDAGFAKAFIKAIPPPPRSKSGGSSNIKHTSKPTNGGAH